MQKIIVCDKEYSIETKVDNLLAILNFIKTTQNNTLAYRSGCRSGVCGSCAMRINGVEKLACKTIVKDNDIIEPLKNSKVIKDLVVDLSMQERDLKESNANLLNKSIIDITIEDEKKIDKETNCILCNSCYSVCPVYDVNKNFKAPFALVRAYRYINDNKEATIKNKIDSIQLNGIWDCTLCGSCNMVCPAFIDIKNDIIMLRNKSAQFGYNNPNFQNSFNANVDFGFDPNNFY